MKLEKEAAQANARAALENKIVGAFFDKKEAHHVVARVRRNLRLRALYGEGALQVAGCTPLEPSAELKKCREAAAAARSANMSLSVLRTVLRGDIPYLIIPEAGALSFAVDEDLKRLGAFDGHMATAHSRCMGGAVQLQ